MSAHEQMRVGVVVERRKIDNPWQEFRWTPIDVISGISPEMTTAWKILREEADWAHILVGAMDIELHRGETEGYRTNLSNSPPRVYVVLSPGEEAEDPDVVPFLVTVCPYEAERYTESGEDIVEGVTMPIEIAAWVQGFVDKHHVDAPFKKRKQKKAYDPRKGGLGSRPKIDLSRPDGGLNDE